MSILLKSGDNYLEIRDEDLAHCAISAEEFDARSAAGAVADKSLAFDTYSEAVQIGCGCCMDKKSLNASC